MRRYLTLAVGAVILTACTARDDARSDTAALDSPAPAAIRDAAATATIRDASGRDLGTLTLTDTTGGIAVSGRLSGLPPGEHGMHFHMAGRCDPPTFESAGEHWNPATRQHGRENPQGPHFGDMPNVSAGADSTAVIQAVTPGGSLRASDMLLDADGAAVVIHSSRDDYQTNPSGGSGSPMACGVITSG